MKYIERTHHSKTKKKREKYTFVHKIHSAPGRLTFNLNIRLG